MGEKIPQFKTEQEEADFWDVHDSTDFHDETDAVDVTFVDARPAMKQISLRLEPSVIEELKSVAAGKGIGYQTMIRMWVMERLGQEA
jgi:predicted DNA binding CopG/RHH family protein